MALTTSAPPFTRLTTPGGSPSSSISPNTRRCVSGTCSDGFRMNVFPHAMAKGRNHMGTMAGKLKGTMAAHTPTGWRIVSQSTFVATPSRTRPCMVVGMAVAASTISIMRATSALASGSVLPISRVTDRASSSCSETRACRKPNSQRARSITGRSRHSAKASRAAATAVSTSAAVDSGTRAMVSPVAGLVTSSSSPLAEGVQRPPM